jgi:hypothetical protein
LFQGTKKGDFEKLIFVGQVGSQLKKIGQVAERFEILKEILFFLK